MLGNYDKIYGGSVYWFAAEKQTSTVKLQTLSLRLKNKKAF